MSDELDLEPIKERWWGGTAMAAPRHVRDIRALVAEVERLRAENESLQGQLDEIETGFEEGQFI